MARTGRRTQPQRRNTTWTILALVAVLAVATAAILALRPADQAPLEAGDDPVLGDAQAPVTVFYFADFQCPHCRNFELGGGMDALRAGHIETGEVRLVAKDFPILGPDSERAAQASQYVWEHAPGAYWDWHHGLFERQGVEGGGWATTDFLVAYTAERVEDIDAADMRAALDEGRLRDEMVADVDAGESFGVRSTPTLVVGDRAYSAADTTGVERAIREALDAAQGSA